MQKAAPTKCQFEQSMGVSKKEISPCPIDVTLSLIDGRWKDTILWRLLDRPMRTNEIRRVFLGSQSECFSVIVET